MKFVLLLGVLLVAWLVWRARRPGSGGSRSQGQGATPPPPGTPAAPQDMVRCEVCGLHLPRADALADARGRHFCGPEHRDQAA